MNTRTTQRLVNRIWGRPCAPTLAWALVALTAGTLQATTYTWTGLLNAGPHSWDTAGNWGGVSYPSMPGDTANLTVDWSAGPTVNLNTTNTLGTLTLNDTGASGDVGIVVAPNGGALLLNNSGAEVAITSSGAANTISAPIGLATNLNVTTTSALTLSGYLYATQLPIGLQKNGANNTLTLSNPTNALAGSVTVKGGTLRSDANGALGSCPIITVGDSTGSTAATLYIGAAGLTITQAVVVATGSSGTATLSSANSSGTATFSGGVALHKNVTLESVAGGTLVLSGTLDDGAGAFGVTKGGNAATVRLTGPAIKYDGPTVLSGGTYEIATTNTWTPGGIISSSGALAKSASGTLNYTLAHTYSGATTVNAGQLVIAGSSGSAANSAFTVQQSGVVDGPGTLVLDGQSGVPATRTKGITVAGNAEVVVLGGTDADTLDVQNGALTAGSGLGTITVHPDAAHQAGAQFTGLGTRANGGTLLLRGTNLGATPAAGVGSVFFTTPPSGANFVGGGSTGPLASIIPYAMVDTATNGLGSALATYEAGKGVRALDAAMETTNLVDATSTMNVLVSSGGTAVGKSVNAMLFDNVSGSPYTLTLDTADLNPISGTFLFTGTSDITFARTSTFRTTLTNTLANAFVAGPGTATINTPFVFTNSSGLVKSGPGTLVLGSAITITGPASAAAPIYINQGVLKQGAASVAGGGRPTTGTATTLYVRQGGVLDLNGYDLYMPGNTKANVDLGGVIRNSGANATMKSGQYTSAHAINGLVLDGTPGDGATSGLVSFTQGNQPANWVFSHGGHTINNLTQSDNSVYNSTMTLSSLTPADSNTVYGTVSVSTGRLLLRTTADAGSSEVARTIGSAPVTIGNANSDFQVLSRGATTPLTAANTLVWSNNVTVNASGAITIGRWDAESVGVTQQFGNLSIGAYTLKVNANDGYTLAFGGTQTLTGNAGFNVASGTLRLTAVGQTGSGRTLTKSGAGTLDLSGTQTYTGMTTVSAGTLAGDYTLAGGLSTAGGAALSPGGSTGAAVSDLGSLSMTNSTYVVTLNGPAAGQYDQLKVASTYGGDGTVVLQADTMLQVVLGYQPDRGTAFTIIDNDAADAVVGTFLGLPQGALLDVVTGSYSATFQLLYNGGDGNDVVLEVPGPPASVLLIK